ncbi:hypothetical protein BU26DRAFT_326110 [Trematosphaeria pertusa]|uniref:Uncharacterized protein n=1 Tax=Trematosphaeria pertusa TaxID=390896 RepID=A0A6A6IEV3_9PLEO|nr:uncharacterized protein BU26DRAFT_326110 [Trematosphaeria pertusa]KAF2248043.1 hypothetical protein BU26DRAFT_326110 [Trematosphaeria pertusa]
MRLRTLNGAPLCEQLDFGPETLLAAEQIEQFLYEKPYQSSQEQGTAPPLKWRRLAAKDTRLRTGWSQPYLPVGPVHGSNPDLSFSIPDVEDAASIIPEDTTNLDTTLAPHNQYTGIQDFVQHSLIFHDTLLSSQLAAEAELDHTVSSSSFLGTSFETTGSDMDGLETASNQNLPVQIPSTLALTSLAALPSPQHLRSIYPQTPTPNFLCVLTAPPEQRQVVVRKGGHRMNLHEITVADNTMSGFKVSFWSRPTTDGNSLQGSREISLVKTLERVRVGDILLLRNIALNIFRDTVYGQSLNPSITRVKTTIEVLMSGGGISSYQLGALPGAVVAAFMRVKKWANTHVAPDRGPSRKRKGRPEGSALAKRSLRSSDVHNETLPPDTLEPT